MKTETKHVHFRVETMKFLHEMADCAIPSKFGVLKIPLNIFKNLLAQAAQRATELNDPILNRIMFNLTLYELQHPSTKEYKDLMEQVYKAADNQAKKETIQKVTHP